MIALFSLLKNVQKSYDLIVYSETANDWVHIGDVVENFLKFSESSIAYFHSDPDENRTELKAKYADRFNLFPVKNDLARSFIFPQLKGKTVLMTMTDLGKGQLKKSPHVENYVYIFHSITSTHMCYLADAFDNYDTICCVGPHHQKEIRKRESLFNLKKKHLIEFGHSHIERLRAHFEKNPIKPSKRQIIIAPSWGPTSIIETVGRDFYENLLNNGFSLYIRLHNMSAKRRHHFATDIYDLADKHEEIFIDDNHLDLERLGQCCLMISEWSGAATEFAFGLKRPVIFIDTPKKIRNKSYKALDLEPLEVSIRSKIGKIVAISDANSIGTWLADFIDNGHVSTENIDMQYHKLIHTKRPPWKSLLSELSKSHPISI